MSAPVIAAALAASAAGSLVFSTLTYSLRELSRVRLDEYLDRRGHLAWLEPTMDHQLGLVFVTAVWRLLFNVAILLLSLELAAALAPGPAASYVLAVVIGTLVTLVCSVMLPTSLAQHAGDAIVGAVVRPLHGLYYVMWPVAKLMHAIDRLVGRAAGASVAPGPDKVNHDIQQEILSAVEEGEKEGAVEEEERAMIESVISFGATTAGQIMTPRPEVVSVESTATLTEIQAVLERSGHSRIPVCDDTLDSIVGVLYARDLLKQLGKPPDAFDMRSAVRPAFYAPETRKLRDLLHDFRLQKIHMAIVLDEYGGTAGVVTIE
ncbi:MAG: corC 1, partial [Phycisphaerales bacterium]|nr:corC 1 [Phycisphaerales bacterium]